MSTTAEASQSFSKFLRRSDLTQLAQRGEILVDRRPAPRVDLRRRQGGDLFGSSTSTSRSDSPTMSPLASALATTVAAPASTAASSTIVSPSDAAASSSMSSSATDSATGTSLATAPTSTGSSLPKPFDTSLGSNFTSQSCPNFFNSFLNNDTFSSCLPLSLLLQNSNSFFTASKSSSLITNALIATCNVVFPTCSMLMSTLAAQIKLDSNCGSDYRAENPLVLQAYAGLVAYEPLYQAGCLKDNSTGDYCFSDAITNVSSPTDSYVYYLPLGIELPGGSRPTCSPCLQQTMQIFQGAAGNSTQPISTDYVTAAQQIDVGCGPQFVNATIAKPSRGLAVGTMAGRLETFGILCVALLTVWLGSLV